MAEGMESPAIIDLFERVSREEMKHLAAHGGGSPG
jgi:rubrerythrin